MVRATAGFQCWLHGVPVPQHRPYHENYMVTVRSGGPKPRKELGQHFLRDTGILQDIAQAVRPPEDGMLVEIGAGTGQLTEFLLRYNPGPLVALEIEDRLIPFLEKRFVADARRLKIVKGDARIIDTTELVRPGTAYSCVGNLPYFAGSPIIRHFLEAPNQPTELVVMVQREVARRILAKPGHLSLLAVCVQVYSEPEQLLDVPPEAFDPPPQVWSSVIRLTVRKEPIVPWERLDAFFDLVSGTFLNPRKQLKNARWTGFGRDATLTTLEEAGIDPMRRPETLAIPEWVALLDARERARRG